MSMSSDVNKNSCVASQLANPIRRCQKYERYCCPSHGYSRKVSIPFRTPIMCQLIGGSAQGKSSFLINALVFEPETLVPDKIAGVILFYENYQPMYNKLRERFSYFQAFQGLSNSSIENLPVPDNGEKYIVIIDDVAMACDSMLLPCLSTRARHFNVSATFYVHHTLFACGKFNANVNTSTNAFIFFHGPRLISQIKTFSTQTQLPKIDKIYKEATSGRDFAYVIVDLSQNQTSYDRFQFRTNVLQCESSPMMIFEAME